MGGWFVGGFLVLLGLSVVALVRAKMKAGATTADPAMLERGRTLLRRTSDDPGPGWDLTGSATQARGLDLRFDHDDDPQAEATMLAPGRSGRASNLLTNINTIHLPADFEDHHVHTSGYVFRVRLRGTGAVIGREVRLGMLVDGKGAAHGGRIENDDDTDAAVGDWIELQGAEILELPGR
ncbi:MAG: hypothetical protein ABFS34_06235 [Gemmatimonadota bacterium]